jgi:hypothetical protein
VSRTISTFSSDSISYYITRNDALTSLEERVAELEDDGDDDDGDKDEPD